MNLKAAILSGAAAAAIGSVAFAQDYGDSPYGNGPQVSTPQEMQQTEQLNQQAINGTTQSPAVLNGEENYSQAQDNAPQDQYPNQNGKPPQYQNQSDEGGGAYAPGPYNGDQAQYNVPPANGEAAGAPPYAPNQTQYAEPPNRYPNAPVGDVSPQSEQPNYESAAPQGAVSGAMYGETNGPQAQYNEQEQQYQQQLQEYQGARERYNYNSSRFARDVRAYDLAQYAWSFPAPFVYRFNASFLRPLVLVGEPSTQLWRAPVEGPGGRWVGRVRNVDIAPDGRALRVEVALNRRVSVWVDPGNLRFDPVNRILYTDLTREQLWTLPGATIVSGPL